MPGNGGSGGYIGLDVGGVISFGNSGVVSVEGG